MAKMDKNSRQEVLDNDWLKREVRTSPGRGIQTIQEMCTITYGETFQKYLKIHSIVI